MSLPRPPPDAHDAVGWLQAIAENADRQAFIRLFGAFAPKVKSYLVRQGLDDRHAEDLTQDTFLMIWRKAAQFDPERATASAWILRIARNLSIDDLRRGGGRSRLRLTDDAIPQQSPEDLLRVLEGEDRLRAELAGLPEIQFEVLRLAFFEDQSHAQIAARLGLPLGTVKSRLRLGMNKMRNHLAGIGASE